MKYCPKCGAEAPDRYCANCGYDTEQQQVCPSCGEPVSGRFCTKCGCDVKKANKVPRELPAFVQKGGQAAVAAKNFVLAHKKQSIIVASALVLAITLTIILCVTLSNIFRIGKVSKIELGMTEKQVEKILGEPHDISDSSGKKWYYFEKSFKKDYDKVAELLESDKESDWEKAEEYYVKLEEKPYKQIMVVFDGKGKVISVFFDKQHKYSEKDDYQTVAKKADEIEFSIEYATAFDKVNVDESESTLVLSGDALKPEYEIFYDDGSYYHNTLSSGKTELSADKKSVKYEWSTKLGDYKAALPLKTVGKMNTSGTLIAWYDKSAKEIVIPDGIVSVADGVFKDNNTVESIIFPDSIEYVGKNFEKCPNLKYNTSGNGKYLGNEDNPYLILCSAVNKNIDINLHANTKVFSSGCFAGLRGNLIFNETNENFVSINGSILSKDYSTVVYAGKNTILLPETVTQLTFGSGVTSIPERFLNNNTGIITVNIPENIITIGSSAFSGCTGLTSITIPDSVTNIGSFAFYNCTSLTSVTIGNSVKSIGIDAFYNCTSLTSVYITDIAKWCAIDLGYGNYTNDYTANPLYYAKNLYLNGTLITELVIPDGVTSIGSCAFRVCTSLTSVTIPNSVTSIGDRAFNGCTSLTNVTIPDSVTGIGYYAFEGCTGLTSVTFGDSLTNISSHAFSGCTSLTSVTFGNSVTSIGYYAFYKCTSLTSVTIPNSVTSIGDRAFNGCTGLTSVTIGNSVTSIGNYAFCNTGYYNNSANWENDVLYIGKYLIEAKDTISGSYTIKDGTLRIANYAFEDCYGLTSVTIPDSVTSIGIGAFYGCTELTNATFKDTTTWRAGDTTFLSSELAAKSTAAIYLKLAYFDCTWTKS